MTVKIGHARLDENAKAKNGLAGDQNGKEVVIQDWYLRTGGWSKVFRAKDFKIAEKIAQTMEQACKNDNIGYDQSQRTTLYYKAKEQNWNLSKIREKCECDCSSLVAVCIIAAGIIVSKDMYTGNQAEVLQRTGHFEVLKESKYLEKSNHLKRGDILLGPGHTAIVLTDSVNISNSTAEIATTEKAQSYNSSFRGTYKVTATKLNVRFGAGTHKLIMVAIPKKTEVKCYGYYTSVLGTNWLYVQFTYKNILYTGFTSANYLTKNI
jgi:hypothetical protein